MATSTHATRTAGRTRNGAITLAAMLYCWFGFAFLVSSLVIVTYTLPIMLIIGPLRVFLIARRWETLR